MKVGPTPTERYDKLLVDIGALELTNLGKRPSKTYSVATSHGDLDGIIFDQDLPPSKNDSPAITEALSSKALKLHDDFAEESLDAQKLLMHAQDSGDLVQDSARRVGQASGRRGEPVPGKYEKPEVKAPVVLDETLVRALEQGRVDM